MVLTAYSSSIKLSLQPRSSVSSSFSLLRIIGIRSDLCLLRQSVEGIMMGLLEVSLLTTMVWVTRYFCYSSLTIHSQAEWMHMSEHSIRKARTIYSTQTRRSFKHSRIIFPVLYPISPAHRPFLHGSLRMIRAAALPFPHLRVAIHKRSQNGWLISVRTIYVSLLLDGRLKS